MSASTILDTIAPQFKDNTEKDNVIALASLSINPDWFGAKTDYATALLAAHSLTLYQEAQNTGAGGSIVSKKEGDLSVSYAPPPIGLSALGQTFYGREFELIKNAGNAGIGVLGGNDVFGQ